MYKLHVHVRLGFSTSLHVHVHIHNVVNCTYTCIIPTVLISSNLSVVHVHVCDSTCISAASWKICTVHNYVAKMCA